MDIEQIKLVVDAVVKLGEQGKGAFIVWVVMDKALPFIGWMAALGVVAKVLLRLIAGLTSPMEATLKSLRKPLGVFCYDSDNLTDEHMAAIQEAVRKLTDKK